MFAPLVLALGIVFAADQASKAWALDRSPRAGRWRGMGIRISINQRRLGGRTAKPRALIVLWLCELLLILLLMRTGLFPDHLPPQIALGAALGGAAGNVYDRLRRGGVVDFIDLRFWPVFNLGDAAIVIGAMTCIAALWPYIAPGR